MSGYTIIDVDTHVTESPDLWTSRAPARMRDQVPRIETSRRWEPIVGRRRRRGPDRQSRADRHCRGREYEESA